MGDELNEDAFQQELVDLFAIEAQEWLQQARSALQLLESKPSPDLIPQLVEVIQRGVSNLGGSAATVELPAIEQLAFTILPALESLDQKASSATSQDFAAVREPMEKLAATIQSIATPAAGPAPSASSSQPESQSASLIEGLQNLQQALIASSDTNRNLIDLVIQKAGDGSGQSQSRLDAASLNRILKELEGSDEQFLAEVQRRMPLVTEAISGLKQIEDQAPLIKPALAPVLQTVQELQEHAHHAHAAGLMKFFRGLHRFLTVVADQGTTLVRGHLQMVESRLGIVVPMAQQWVEVGRGERAAIGRLLSS